MSRPDASQGATGVVLDAPWLGDRAVQAVLKALDGRACFVGGCVRNALMGRGGTDIDLTTALRPEEVVAALEAAGLRAVPTGIEHGTVTAVAEGQGIEITTFRADVETDGRRALVRFTDDMAEDARRRDFTMNALYADARGRVLDPLGGLGDLRAGRVRFIGRAEDRIREDYLRILRFYRFTAWYGTGPPDPDGQEACRALAGGLPGLARERLGAEMRKLLAAPDPAPALAAMAAAGALEAVLPGAAAAPVAGLVAAEREAGAGADWLRRLAALGAPDAPELLRLSRAEARGLSTIASLRGRGPAVAAEMGGMEAARSAVLLDAAAAGQAPPEALDGALAKGAAAVFPLSADRLIAAGWPRGPELGRALTAAREIWRAEEFAPDAEELLARLPRPDAG